MSKYLYGAAVQGIQGFIFQTNKLREIVGASELVEQICGALFAEVLYDNRSHECKQGVNPDKSPYDRLKEDPNAILNAAGNIKYIFDDEKQCKRVARLFPKTVMEFAPGITISQSVVNMDGMSFSDAVQQLEKNLRTQRNKPMRDLNIGLTGILRSRETGLPVTHVRYKEYIDSATYHKLFDEKSGNRKETFTLLCQKAFGNEAMKKMADGNIKLPIDEMRDMTHNNDWIAIIHADGNGLGRIVQKIGTDRQRFREFSRKLDAATTAAAVSAFNEVMAEKLIPGSTIPMRPIVLSGDDHTIICRADIAIPYTQAFLKYFEKETHDRLGDILRGKKPNGSYDKPIFEDRSDYLTACAGIAFIKSSYPFHFGYKLAEALCDRAKKDSKKLFEATSGNLPASCLMFHKVQDSFVSNYDDIAERELSPQPNISFRFGPYYQFPDIPSPNNGALSNNRNSKIKNSGRWTVSKLLETAEKLNGKEGNAVKSHLRNWLSILHDDPAMAQQNLDRLYSVTPMKEYVKSLTLPPDSPDNGSVTSHVRREKIEENDGENKENIRIVYPVYDILSVHTINNQTTR